MVKNVLDQYRGKGYKLYLKKYVFFVRGRISSFFSSNGRLANFYFAIFERSYDSEQKTVLCGIKKFNQGLDNIALLRRNTHKIEKGLTMIPRRKVFATEYILETVKLYNTIVNREKSVELDWSFAILEKYFSVVDKEHSNVKKAFSLYEKVREKKVLTKEDPKVPYLRERETPVSAGDLLDIFKYRKSVRWYADKIVEIEKVEKAVLMALTAPSACNRQPFSFHYIANKQKVDSICKLVMGTSGFGHNINNLMVVVGDLSSFNMVYDRHVVYIDASLASMQLMLALDSLGLASCPINWPDRSTSNKKICKILNLKEYEKTIMLISFGYERRNVEVPYSGKKRVEDLLKIIK